MPTVDGRNANGVIVGTSDALDSVPVVGSAYEHVLTARNRVAAALDAATGRFAALDTEIATATAEHDQLVQTIGRLEIRRKRLGAAARVADAAQRSLLIHQFTTAYSDVFIPAPGTDVDATLARLDETNLDRFVARSVTGRWRAIRSRRSEVVRVLRARTERRDQLVTLLADRDARRREALLDMAERRDDLEDADDSVKVARATTDVAGSDLPTIALDAYWRAAIRVDEEQPTCNVGWWALAGVGRTESNHGRHAGGTLQPGGLPTVPIVGIPLDGTSGTRLIPDTDGGTLDGDPTVDRAVGPMQFIPGTWRRWAEDLSGDGRADPQNIYDAALAAARKLCADGGDLATGAGLRTAYFSYNRSLTYVERVLARSLTYRDLAVPPGPGSLAPTDLPPVTTAPAAASAPDPVTVPVPRPSGLAPLPASPTTR
ncbi:MAG: lytic transglycosylase domain-containing protein [Microthrixaceae bacterium]